MNPNPSKESEPKAESLTTCKNRLQLGLSPDERDRAEAINVWKEKFADIIDYSATNPSDCQRIFVSGYIRGLRSARHTAKAIVIALLLASATAFADPASMDRAAALQLQRDAARHAEAERIHHSVEIERARLREIAARPMPASPISGLPQVVPVKPIVITYPPKQNGGK
jgi:hypothetical protein